MTTSFLTARKLALVVIAAIVAALLPFAQHPLPVNQAFLPMILGIALMANAITALMLFRSYRHGGPARTLGFAIAYCFAAFIVVAYGLAFPGIVTAQGLTAGNASTASWLWRSWHLGYPLILAITYAAESLYEERLSRFSDRRFHGVWATAGVAAFVTALAGSLYAFADRLPVAIFGNHFAAITDTGVLVVLLTNLIAIVVVAKRCSRASAIERVALVSAVAFTADTLLGAFAGGRYTVGWYTSRLFTVVAAVAVLIIVVTELSRVYRRSEVNVGFSKTQRWLL